MNKAKSNQTGAQDGQLQERTAAAYVRRIFIYAVGMVLLATGIILNTKTAMGVSPLVSVAYCAARLSGRNFSNMTLVLYLIYFGIECLLLRKEIHAVDFLQIPFCYVFTRCMNLISVLLPDPWRLSIRILILAAAIVCTGFGSAIMVNAHLIPNPADGLVKQLSVRIHKKMGVTKNIFDAVCVGITIVIGVAAARRLIGIGVGTVCAVLGIGRAVALCNRLFSDRIAQTVRSAPIRIFDGSD